MFSGSYDCPSRFDFKARTKFDAWSQLGAMPKAEAMQVYADRYKLLLFWIRCIVVKFHIWINGLLIERIRTRNIGVKKKSC